MRYLCWPEREQSEAESIPYAFGKQYAPHGPVSLCGDSQLRASGVELVELNGQTLAIQPDTASWAFLDPTEVDVFKRIMDGASFRSLQRTWRSPAVPAQQFATVLFRRGLMTIDGQTAVDGKLFDDSANYNEAHLVELLLTERCNLSCGYCLAGASPSMPAMDASLARRAVDLAFGMVEAQAIGFEFSGGEPFLQFGMMRELVDYIRNHPMRLGRRIYLTIQTNCTLLNEERVRWIKENEIQVGISLDGNPVSQNWSRPQVNGGESFPKLIAGVDLLQRMKVPFGALVVLNRSNIHSVGALTDFLLDNGIYTFKLNPIAYLGNGRQNWSTLGLEQDEIIAYFKELMHLIADTRYHLLEANLRTMCDFLISKERRSRCLRTHCGAGDTFQAVAANGDIYPCGRATQTPAMKLGNIRDEGLASLSAAGAQHPIIEDIRTRRPGNLDGCDVCYYRQLCQAGCSAQAFERYGTVRHRTPECSFFKTLYPYLMRWLCFDPEAFRSLNEVGYFGKGATLFQQNTIAAEMVAD